MNNNATPAHIDTVITARADVERANSRVIALVDADASAVELDLAIMNLHHARNVLSEAEQANNQAEFLARRASASNLLNQA